MPAWLGPVDKSHSAVISLPPEDRRGRIRVRIDERTLFNYFDTIEIQQIDPTLSVA